VQWLRRILAGAALTVSVAYGGDTLRSAAAARGIYIGSAVASRLLQQPEYASVVAREFNQLQPENETKMRFVHPARDRFDFSGGDAIAAFAAAHGMKMRGHVLVWHEAVPDWVTKGGFTPDQLRDILRQHITTEVSHFAGKVYAWDVVNEAVEKDGSMRHSVWSDIPDYIADAFRTAHAADPAALLFYNDYDTEGRNAKSDAVYALAQKLLHDGVPINGVGFQCHLTRKGISKQDFMANLARFTALGLQVQITELDVRVPLDNGAPKPEDLERQARVYADVAGACVATPHCTAIQTWGFTDRYSWVPYVFKGTGAALPFDADYRPKPAYTALLRALEP
jgi:endo-1,4-beta-xylanase